MLSTNEHLHFYLYRYISKKMAALLLTFLTVYALDFFQFVLLKLYLICE